MERETDRTAGANCAERCNDPVILDPIWQPGNVWPDTADEGMENQAMVQIYSPDMKGMYITTVPTHRRTNPFIDHFGEDIMWAYMRDVEERLAEEWKETVKRIKEQRRRQAEHLPAVEAAGTGAEPQQLMLDFG